MKLYLSEYLADGQEPPLAESVVEFGPSSVASEPFSHLTKVVRIHVDAPASIAFGENPVATTDSQRMAGNTTERRTVPQGQRVRVAVISNPGPDDETFDFTSLYQGLEQERTQ
jgi:hypothetical protein